MCPHRKSFNSTIPIIHGLGYPYCFTYGKAVFESISNNFDWVLDTVKEQEKIEDHCKNGWFWDGAEGCAKVCLIVFTITFTILFISDYHK